VSTTRLAGTAESDTGMAAEGVSLLVASLDIPGVDSPSSDPDVTAAAVLHSLTAE
jgi:hypothetical protein